MKLWVGSLEGDGGIALFLLFCPRSGSSSILSHFFVCLFVTLFPVPWRRWIVMMGKGACTWHFSSAIIGLWQ